MLRTLYHMRHIGELGFLKTSRMLESRISGAFRRQIMTNAIHLSTPRGRRAASVAIGTLPCAPPLDLNRLKRSPHEVREDP